MGWFTKFNNSGVPEMFMHDVEAVWAFQPDVTYFQVDLDGRDAVEGVAHYFMETGQRVGGFALAAAEQIDAANSAKTDPDKPFAVYVGVDRADCLIAMVYARHDYEPSHSPAFH